MIPKAVIVAAADAAGLFDSTVEKDYVLGWLLFGIAEHEQLSHWAFTGGTCLRKCYFDTYRFSEDLEFAVPGDRALSERSIIAALSEVCAWVEAASGVGFTGLEVGRSDHVRGTDSYQAKVSYRGAINRPRSSLQRVKFNVTRRENLAESVHQRSIFHPYPDVRTPSPKLRCCSVDEILAAKTCALYERQGRAGDVYDLVHISRSFREDVSPGVAREVLVREFSLQQLGVPTVAMLLARVDWDVVRRDWQQQLRHQLPRLPDVKSFAADLHDALAWWIEPARAAAVLRAAPGSASHRSIPRRPFSTPGSLGLVPRSRGELPEAIRFAARNRMLVRFRYQGTVRVVEPYALRLRSPGKVLLCAFEQTNDGAWKGWLKAYVVDEIDGAEALEVRFSPQWAVDL